MTQAYFVTGTDTEIGKTWCSVGLIHTLQQQGLRVVGMKPVAAGCEMTADGWRNADALALQAASNVQVPYAWVNPYALPTPIAPHLAAAQINVEIDLATIEQTYAQLIALADVVVVEGAGGWRVPLTAQHSMRDIALALHASVILVVGMRLGCINHALLSAEAIQRDDCHYVGWIANHLCDDNQDAVIESIQQRIGVPLLGKVPFLPEGSREQVSQYLTLK